MSMTPADEAAAILTRMFETIAHSMGKRLLEIHKSEIRRACELLSADGTLAPLDDLPSGPRVSPAEAMIDAAKADPQFRDWQRRRQEVER